MAGRTGWYGLRKKKGGEIIETSKTVDVLGMKTPGGGLTEACKKSMGVIVMPAEDECLM